jgi:hypothetical protein
MDVGNQNIFIPADQSRLHVDDRFHVFRYGVNYRF